VKLNSDQEEKSGKISGENFVVRKKSHPGKERKKIVTQSESFSA
jgi:hypothetical protein